ncbi:MAG: hypothetical protein ABFE08_17535 [Armatimonadia bacterium]
MLAPQEAPRRLVGVVFDDLKGFIECFGHQHHGYMRLVLSDDLLDSGTESIKRLFDCQFKKIRHLAKKQ